MDLNRIEINVASENIQSIAIAKKIGFQYEGTLREDHFFNGKFYNTQKYSLLQKEWAG